MANVEVAQAPKKENSTFSIFTFDKLQRKENKNQEH